MNNEITIKNRSMDMVQNGISFHVDVKGANVLKKAIAWYQDTGADFYDPLELVQENGGRLFEIESHSGERIHVFGECQKECQIPGRYSKPLNSEEIAGRIDQFCRQLMQCLTDESIEKILLAVPHKKNGTLHKGRIVPIIKLQLADSDAMILILCARNADDLKLEISFRNSYLGDAVSQKNSLALKTGICPAGIHSADEIQEIIERNDIQELPPSKRPFSLEYLQYKEEMKQALAMSYDEYVQKRQITSRKLLEAVSVDEDICIRGKTFILPLTFSFRDEVSREIEQAGGTAMLGAYNTSKYYVADLKKLDVIDSSMARRAQKEGSNLIIITDYQLWKALLNT